jgi:hypothetical protein
MAPAQLLLDGSAQVSERDHGGLKEFMALSVQEEGLVRPSAAVAVLGVTMSRVLTLVQEGRLRSWRFFGRGYLSCRELERRRARGKIPPGRPKLGK